MTDQLLFFNHPEAFAVVMADTEKLTADSDSSEISDRIEALLKLKPDVIQLERFTSLASKRTALGKAPLKARIREIRHILGFAEPDHSIRIAKLVLKEKFANGAHLMRTQDGAFWFFDKTHWTPLSVDDLLRIITPIAAGHPDPEGRNTSTIARDALFHIKVIAPKDEGWLDSLKEPPLAIPLKNGEIWYSAENDSFELSPHRPASGFSYCLETSYEPEASAPIFHKTLHQIFAEAEEPEEMARHWLEICGYTIFGRRNIPCFVLLYGVGRNGKSSLAQTLIHLIGEKSVLLKSLDRSEWDRFSWIALSGKTLLFDDDMSAGAILPDGLLKKISEGKLISARPIRGHTITFRASVLPMAACNNLPQLRDVSLGIRRRALVIPFKRIFSVEEVDPDLFRRIWKEELPGILNLCLDAFRNLNARKVFNPPKECLEARDDWLCQANPVPLYVDQRCILEPASSESVSDLFADMRKWAKATGVKLIPNLYQLGGELEKLGFQRIRPKNKSKIRGLKLKGPGD